MKDQFWVAASHIQLGYVDTFGPYQGPPQLTYENLRQLDDNGPPFEIFAWFDYEDDNGDARSDARSLSGSEGWPHEDGRTRFYGWRRLEHRTIPGSLTGHTKAVGPWYTDLVLTSEDPDPRTG